MLNAFQKVSNKIVYFVMWLDLNLLKFIYIFGYEVQPFIFEDVLFPVLFSVTVHLQNF